MNDTLMRVLRRPAMASLMFLIGLVSAARATETAATISEPALGPYLQLALEALVALVGIVGSVVTLLAALLKKRETLVRGDLYRTVETLTRDVSELREQDRRASDQVESLRREVHADLRDMRAIVTGIRTDVSWITQQASTLTEATTEIMRLLRADKR